MFRGTRGEGSAGVDSAQLHPISTQSLTLRVPGSDPGIGGSLSVPSLQPQVPDPADDIFREALENHKLSLTPGQQQAFLGASAIGLIDIIKGLDQQHSDESRTRRASVKAQGFLQVADGYLTVLGIMIQHNPEYSALIVGGLKFFVDVSHRACWCLDECWLWGN